MKAIDENMLDIRKLENYQKLWRENSLVTETITEKRTHGRDFAKMVKEAKLVKKRRDTT